MAASYDETCTAVATLLQLGDDIAGKTLAATLIATFDGLLIQWLITPATAPHHDAVPAAVERLCAISVPTSRT